MRKLRVLVLVHEDLVPPDDLDGHSDKEIDAWKTEYDVVSCLRDMEHDAQPLGVSSDLAVIRRAIEDFKPQVMAIEQVFSIGRHPKTALLMSHARGAILLTAAEREIPVVHYAATQVKKILTGSGRAPKIQMQQAIQRELGLPELPEPADVADALAIALCHYYLGRNQLQVQDGVAAAAKINNSIVR